MRKIILPALVLLGYMGFAQNNPFHTLNFPSASPQVIEMQKLGITEIEINYHSPALNNRDVWNDPNVIPQNGEPIAWRAGANMNTTIAFSTDVLINEKPLSAGTYGFHVIPKEDTYTLLFAHNNNQWGSYYLDLEKDISLSVDVEAEACPKTEQLDYEFLNRTENSVVVGLEWGEQRLPFTVSVDLNKTVVESFRNELRGLNTYRWEAWNDAAIWCLQHDTNLEEALEWVNRSIHGGFNGFAANKNLANLETKVRLLQKLNRTVELKETVTDALTLEASPYDLNGFSIFLLRNGLYNEALSMTDHALKLHPDTWFLQLNHAIAQFFAKKKSRKTTILLENALNNAPEGYKPRVKEISDEIEKGTFTFGQR
jgi:tetratricopeptide (TPR) repeat protein